MFKLTTDGFFTVANFFGIADPNFRGGARAAVGEHDDHPPPALAETGDALEHLEVGAVDVGRRVGDQDGR